MERPRRNRPLLFALYANAALLLAILVALLARNGSGSFLSSAGAAPMPQPIAGNGNLYIMPAQLLNNVWGCYVLDIENQTICTYSYNGHELKFLSARGIRHDHELEKYNTSPDPDEIRRLVQMQKGLNNGGAPPASQPAPAVAPDLNK